MRELVLGSRGSALAVWQAEWVAGRLVDANPGLRLRIERIKTEGDVKTRAPLWQIGGGGLFVKEIERALRDGRIDLAVHSMKDLPIESGAGLVVAAVPERADPRDVWVSRDGLGLVAVRPGAKVGTSSSRRRAQLLAFRGDLEIVPLRGNVDTRLRKLEEDGLDGMVLAAAGLGRLGRLDRVTEYLDPEICLPAVGQGALAIQTREGDDELLRLLSALEHPASRCATDAERSFMRGFGGGCQLPMAALCRVGGEALSMDALVASADGARVIRRRVVGDVADPIGLGAGVATQLLADGAVDLLKDAPR